MSGRPGLVAAGHPVTAQAGARVLSAGGNAIDAVVAAGFAASVAEPMLTSMAGGGFCLVHTAAGEDVVVDFFVDVPGRGRVGAAPPMDEVEVAFVSTTQCFHVGWGSVAVPGCFPGWLHLHERWGRLPLEVVLAPAIEAAGGGVIVNEQQAYLFQILAPVVARTPAVAARFAPDGVPLPVEANLVQPDVAAFLELAATNPAAARSRFGEALLAGAGGGITAADLEHYAVVERAPLTGEYRGHVVTTNPAPGGHLVLDQLRQLAVGPPLTGWLDPNGPRRFVEAQLAAEARAARAATQGTTHVSIADAEGNVVAMTTSNGTGAGCALDGLGIVANNMLGEDDLFPDGLGTGTPGARMASMMSPTSLRRGDDVVLAVGSGGSKRIRTALTQVIAHAVDHERDLQAAVSGPRVHHDGAVVQVEPGFGATAVDALRQGYAVNEWDSHDLYFGGAHAVAPGVAAAGDPRRGGATARR